MQQSNAMLLNGSSRDNRRSLGGDTVNARLQKSNRVVQNSSENAATFVCKSTLETGKFGTPTFRDMILVRNA